MNGHNIKAIIFDLGNVWIDFNHLIAARKMAKFTNKKPEDIFNMFFDSPITAQFEEGRINPFDFFLSVKNKLNLGISYEEFLPVWNEIFFLSDKNIKTHNLARVLKKNYRLALLSNVNELHFQYIKKEFPVFDIFDYIILSYQLHLRKPAGEIYKKTLEILNLKSNEVVYTDDRIELIQQAGILGIKSFHFQNPDRLKSDLISVGINIDCHG